MKKIALIMFCVSGMTGCQQRYTDGLRFEQTAHQVEPVLSLPGIALKQRPEVESLIGKPITYKKRATEGEFGDEAAYSWGTIAYNKGRVVFLIVKFPSRPANYHQAFAVVGLPQPPLPFVRNDGTLIWSDKPYKNGYQCCDGLVFHDIFIDGTMSEMHVEILDLDDPSSWNAPEGQTLKKWTGKARSTSP
jgi:hypothetical protein